MHAKINATGLVFEFGLLSGGPATAPARIDETDQQVVPQSEVEAAATAIERANVGSAEELVFVTGGSDYSQYIFRVLVAAEIEIPGWQASFDAAPPIRVHPSRNGTDCKATVVFKDDSITVTECGDSNENT